MNFYQHNLASYFIHTIVFAQARAKIGMMNLTYNICRCTQLIIMVEPVVSNAELMR